MKIYIVKFPEGMSRRDGLLVSASNEAQAMRMLSDYVATRKPAEAAQWGRPQDATVCEIGTSIRPMGVVLVLYDVGYDQ